MSYKRIYRGPVLKELESGSSHICGLVNETNRLECWQWLKFNSTEFNSGTGELVSAIAVGENFVCGLLELGQVKCLGGYRSVIDNLPSGNYITLAAGSWHVCGISKNGSLVCWGEMVGEKPNGRFQSVAMGQMRSCALRLNGTVACWGQNGFVLPEYLRETVFMGLESKNNVFCGIATANYSLFCWGNENLDSNSVVFERVVPGPCRSECPCGFLPGYGTFCRQGLKICEACRVDPCTESTFLAPPPLAPPRATSKWNRKMVAFLVVGCVGSFSLVVVSCFLFFRYCKVTGSRIHDSGPLDEPGPPQSTRTPPPVLEKRLSHLVSMGNGSHLEEFSFEMLLQATDNFSDQHKIGSGSFGSVYHATLDDGRQVAVKRAESMASSSFLGPTKRQEDMDNAFVNELEFLSNLNHKNLVRLLGYCEDRNELILVYEYMNNGSLHHHLHKLESSPLMHWSERIKVALDAARGIEYLHVYAVPQIIHRDIKSSNILLDASWTAKVSDFGLSLMGPKDDESHLSLHAAGTVGYMDPEYYRLQVLTTKSDVYSFGVVLLELLSGYKAIHKNGDGVPRNVVDYVVPYIVQDEVHRVLDPKVPPPTPYEIEAVAYIGYLAADCVTLQGKDRPTMSEIVNSLERALAACMATPMLSRSTSGSE